MKLTTNQLDILTELINIGVGQAAGMLNSMIEYRIKLQIPGLKLLSLSELQQQLNAKFSLGRLSSVQLEFSGLFSGTTQLIFPTDSAAILVEVITGEESETPSLNELKIATLTEVGNILINGVMGSISNILTQRIHYNLPCYIEADIDHLLPLPMSDAEQFFILAQTRFDISEIDVQGDIILFFNVDSFQSLLVAIDNAG